MATESDLLEVKEAPGKPFSWKRMTVACLGIVALCYVAFHYMRIMGSSMSNEVVYTIIFGIAGLGGFVIHQLGKQAKQDSGASREI